jgi:hypothetical protein
MPAGYLILTLAVGMLWIAQNGFWNSSGDVSSHHSDDFFSPHVNRPKQMPEG